MADNDTQIDLKKRARRRLVGSAALALAAAIGLEPGEEVQWELLDRAELHLLRHHPTPASTQSRARK